jgi:hypothetical protein
MGAGSGGQVRYLPLPGGDILKYKLKSEGKPNINIKNKRFWEELIAYFPLIRHGPHTKRLV